MRELVTNLEALWIFFMRLTGDAPLWLWTPMVGFAIAWGLTNAFKRWLCAFYPMHYTQDEALAKRRSARYDLLIETFAIVCGGAVTYLLMGGGPNGALVAFATAVLTPYGWRMAVVIFSPIGAWWKRYWAHRSPDTPKP